jgi:hypothetical protein
MKEVKNYSVRIRITDRMRKPDHLQGQSTKERVNWVEEIEAKGMENEEQAQLAILMHLEEVWPESKYKKELLNIRETLILPQEGLILPEDS